MAMWGIVYKARTRGEMGGQGANMWWKPAAGFDDT